MSYKVTAWVLDHSEATLAARLVLLAMSEVAHDDGGMTFQSVATLAHKARIGESTARGCLRRLEADGRIEPQGTTRNGTVIYRVKMADAPEMVGGPESEGGQIRAVGGQNLALGGQILAPNRYEPLEEPSEEGARGRARVKVGGRPVKHDAWVMADQVLAEFNTQTGRHLRLLTSAAQPSEAAKRIYSRVVLYPDLKLDDYARIIRNTLASKWWGDDRASVGVVFGPNVFEENITRKASRAKPRGGVMDKADPRTAAYRAKLEADQLARHERLLKEEQATG